jgi:hypothetical protein
VLNCPKFHHFSKVFCALKESNAIPERGLGAQWGFEVLKIPQGLENCFGEKAVNLSASRTGRAHKTFVFVSGTHFF